MYLELRETQVDRTQHQHKWESVFSHLFTKVTRIPRVYMPTIMMMLDGVLLILNIKQEDGDFVPLRVPIKVRIPNLPFSISLLYPTICLRLE